MNVRALITKNQSRWDAMVLDSGRKSHFEAIAKKILLPAHWERYVKISKAVWPTNASLVLPAMVGVYHYREADLNFACQLAQGDPLDRPSTHEPAGVGPFHDHDGEDAFHWGAVVALTDCAPHAGKWTDWSAGGTMTISEEYNGLGYANRGVPSAYVWSGSNQYVRGKYVADHDYDPNAVDIQDGCACILKSLIALNPSIQFGASALPAPSPTSPAPSTPVSTPVPLWQLLVEAVEKEIPMPSFLLPLLLSVATNPAIDASVEQMIAGILSGIANSAGMGSAGKALIMDVQKAIPDIVGAVVSNTPAAAAIKVAAGAPVQDTKPVS